MYYSDLNNLTLLPINGFGYFHIEALLQLLAFEAVQKLLFFHCSASIMAILFQDIEK